MRMSFASLIALLLATAAQAQSITAEQKSQLALTGALRAAIVTIPFLAKKDASGAVTGVAPDLAAEMARVLAVPYQPTVYETPNAGIKAMRDGMANFIFLAPTPDCFSKVADSSACFSYLIACSKLPISACAAARTSRVAGCE